jgi:hypothetical protein
MMHQSATKATEQALHTILSIFSMINPCEKIIQDGYILGELKALFLLFRQKRKSQQHRHWVV